MYNNILWFNMHQFIYLGFIENKKNKNQTENKTVKIKRK